MPRLAWRLLKPSACKKLLMHKLELPKLKKLLPRQTKGKPNVNKQLSSALVPCQLHLAVSILLFSTLLLLF
jgi:hypothetical protein